jgi:nucleoside-triphosphatase THEP1
MHIARGMSNKKNTFLVMISWLMRCTIITGTRDAGKTRKAAETAARLREEGATIGGIISEARMERGVKIGYAYVDLATGKRVEYARRKEAPVPPGERAFEFLDEGIAFGCKAIRAAAADRVEALFVDEIGPLEMGGGGLWAAVLESLRAFGGQVILTVRPSLAQELRAKIQPLAESVQIVETGSRA